MNFNDITKLNREVRVVGSTDVKDVSERGGRKDMVGKECILDYIDFGSGIVKTEDYYWFNLTDVAFLTPLSFKGKRIAIGDTIEFADTMDILTEGVIYGYYWYDNEWILTVVKDNNFNGGCEEVYLDKITVHRIPTEKSLSGTEVEVIIDGKSYPAVIR